MLRMTHASASLSTVFTRVKVSVHDTSRNVRVVINFLSQVIFIFPLFLGMVIYANEFETKKKQKLPEIKN